MKCLKCGEEMEKGALTGDSTHWMRGDGIMGGVLKIFNVGFGSPRVWAYRCPTCKKIELVSE